VYGIRTRFARAAMAEAAMSSQIRNCNAAVVVILGVLSPFTVQIVNDYWTLWDAQKRVLTSGRRI
jgi:hypothetical protein